MAAGERFWNHFLHKLCLLGFSQVGLTRNQLEHLTTNEYHIIFELNEKTNPERH